MYTYECEICGKHVEIEEMEAEIGDSIGKEAYEFNECIDCFERSLV